MDSLFEKMGITKESAETGELTLEIKGMPKPLQIGGYINVEGENNALYGWVEDIHEDGSFTLALNMDQDMSDIKGDMAVLYSAMYTFRGRIKRTSEQGECYHMHIDVVSPAIRVQQRKYFRLATKLPVILYLPGHRINAYTNDIGIGGISVLLDEKIERESSFLVQINFSRGNKVQLMARVVRAIEHNGRWRNCMCFEQVTYEIDQALARNLFRLEVDGKGHVEPNR